MHRNSLLAVSVSLIAAVGFIRHDAETPAAPRFANIVSACTDAAPQVQPPRITMARQDSVIWREPSGRATQWVITPKNGEDWLFDQASFTGTQQSPATTRRPRAGAQANHPYAYNVRITCSDGRVQNIDPDIVIGDAEQR